MIQLIKNLVEIELRGVEAVFAAGHPGSQEGIDGDEEHLDGDMAVGDRAGGDRDLRGTQLQVIGSRDSFRCVR